MVGLLGELRAVDKKGYFTNSETPVSYPTLFHTLDYRNGFMLRSLDDNNNLIKEQASIGIVGGTFNTVIGKPGAAKTTAVIQMSMNIVVPHENSFVIHCDLESATNLSRVRAVTGVDNKTLKEKYIIKQDTVFLEDIHDMIIKIAQLKIAGKDKYRYDTGLLDEFGEKIFSYVPTVIIIDSIPSIELRDANSLDESQVKKVLASMGSSKDITNEMQGDTHTTRKAKKIAQFYRHLGPIIRQANIIVFAINHINQKIEINPFAKTQAQTMYLKMDESLPGGNAPIYYANNIFKFVTGEKFKAEDHGFDGFLSKCELIKSRTNKAGQVVPLIYNQECGFDNILTLFYFADNELGVVQGRNPYRYFEKYPDIKFDSRKFREEFLKNEELQYALFDSTIPHLERLLSRGRESDVTVDELEIMKRVLESMHKEGLTE